MVATPVNWAYQDQFAFAARPVIIDLDNPYLYILGELTALPNFSEGITNEFSKYFDGGTSRTSGLRKTDVNPTAELSVRNSLSFGAMELNLGRQFASQSEAAFITGSFVIQGTTQAGQGANASGNGLAADLALTNSQGWLIEKNGLAVPVTYVADGTGPGAAGEVSQGADLAFQFDATDVGKEFRFRIQKPLSTLIADSTTPVGRLQYTQDLHTFDNRIVQISGECRSLSSGSVVAGGDTNTISLQFFSNAADCGRPFRVRVLTDSELYERYCA